MKLRIFSFVLFISMLFATVSSAQTSKNKYVALTKFNIGLGMGLDYGGFGGRLTYFAFKNASIFGGYGYNLLGAGYNAGVSVRLMPDKKRCPYFSIMYGYNAVIKINGGEKYNKVYYGTSLGAGCEIRFKEMQNYFNVEFFLPIRSQEFHEVVKTIKKEPLLKYYFNPLPFTYSLGFHLVI